MTVQHERGPRNSTLRRQMSFYFKEGLGPLTPPTNNITSSSSPSGSHNNIGSSRVESSSSSSPISSSSSLNSTTTTAAATSPYSICNLLSSTGSHVGHPVTAADILRSSMHSFHVGSSNKDVSNSSSSPLRNSRNSPLSTNDILGVEIGNGVGMSRKEFAPGPGGIPLVPALDLVMNHARNTNGGGSAALMGSLGDNMGLFAQRNNGGFGDTSSFEKFALLRPQMGLPLFGMPSLKMSSTTRFLAGLKRSAQGTICGLPKAGFKYLSNFATRLPPVKP
ncbi:unnamed protein product [Orchesella dallaii]|uniref:Uncharacterized protein n=1 Tax=Orchesella dallaii TaxID=48710 RepID=A0ABP1R164_9HEXA